MIQRDFLMREIHRMVNLLSQVLFHKKHKRYEEAQQVLSADSMDVLGVDLSEAGALTYDDLTKALTSRRAALDGPDDGQFPLLVAELLRQQGELFSVQGQIEASDHSFQLALHLYLHEVVHHPAQRTPDTFGRLDHLLRQAALRETAPEVLRLLAAYLEQAGRFDEAEDLFFHLAKNTSEEVREEGLAFFDRLLALPDARLAEGGLPRAEVEEGRAAFVRWFEKAR